MLGVGTSRSRRCVEITCLAGTNLETYVSDCCCNNSRPPTYLMACGLVPPPPYTLEFRPGARESTRAQTRSRTRRQTQIRRQTPTDPDRHTPDIQRSRHPEIQTSRHPEIQTSRDPDIQISRLPKIQRSTNPADIYRYIYIYMHKYIHIKPIENISTKATQNTPPPCQKHGPFWTRHGVGGLKHYIHDNRMTSGPYCKVSMQDRQQLTIGVPVIG